MGTELISIDHSNRGAHNWLIYDINDRFLQKFVPLYKGALYDLGAGESPYKEFFLGHAQSYVAVDWSGGLYETKADIAADLNKPLPIDSDVADTIVSLSVLEHLYAPQLMLEEAYRILKSGGAIVLQVPWQWRLHEEPHDYFRYTPYGLGHLLKQAGFVDIEVEAQSGFFTTVTLKMNYFGHRLIKGPKLIRVPLRAVFSVFWYLGQKIAPLLDKLDGNWAAETSGYYVTARKA